jgi:hypothetical protein
MLMPHDMFCSLTNLDIKAPATHPLEIPSQLLMSTDPLMEQTSHQGIPYCRTPAMDSFTGPSNWNRQEVVPPGQSPFQNVGMLVK